MTDQLVSSSDKNKNINQNKTRKKQPSTSLYKKKRNNKKKNIQPNMIPQQWTPPCNNECTHKYAALTQIPWRVFCKKGCDADGDTWEECQAECDEICFKDPVLKDQKWSAWIDRSPGTASYSEECFRACVAGCGYKFEIPAEEVEEVHPNRPPPPVVTKPPPPAVSSSPGERRTSA